MFWDQEERYLLLCVSFSRPFWLFIIFNHRSISKCTWTFPNIESLIFYFVLVTVTEQWASLNWTEKSSNVVTKQWDWIKVFHLSVGCPWTIFLMFWSSGSPIEYSIQLLGLLWEINEVICIKQSEQHFVLKVLGKGFLQPLLQLLWLLLLYSRVRIVELFFPVEK